MAKELLLHDDDLQGFFRSHLYKPLIGSITHFDEPLCNDSALAGGFSEGYASCGGILAGQERVLFGESPLVCEVGAETNTCSTVMTPNVLNSSVSSPSAGKAELQEVTVEQEDQAIKNPGINNQEDEMDQSSLFGSRQPKLNKCDKRQQRQRQPQFAFMTKSEVDHLQDGYRWRKYGQKAVKNNPYPRSYYRCTTTTCGVKKKIERACHDPSIVITTYEGQHTHPSPSDMRRDMQTLAQKLLLPSACPNFPTMLRQLHHASANPNMYLGGYKPSFESNQQSVGPYIRMNTNS